jgi:sugar phosphate isomerase/epimerase
VTIEYGASTSAVQGDVRRLRLLERYPVQHVEIGFFRAELLDQVLGFVRARGWSYGFHDPLPWHPDWRWPSLTDPDVDERSRSLRVVAHTLDSAACHGASYVLAHFPSVHFETLPGWNDDGTLAAARDTATTLEDWSMRRAMPILLENVGPNPYWRSGYWCDIMAAHPGLSFCLDIGHLHLEACQGRVDTLDFVRDLAPYTRQVHVYNATPEAYSSFHHVPAHPEQDPSQGWIDIPAVFDVLMGSRDRSRPLRVIFEHTPDYPVDEDYVLEGMYWVQSLAGA